MKKNLIIPVIFIIFYFVNYNSYSQCNDEVVLDGSEKILTYGIDSTGNWWAVTEPMTGNYRVVINGKQSEIYHEVKNLIFSPDGQKWAFFAKDITQWHIVSNDGVTKLPGTDVGEMLFSNNSQNLIYSYKDGEQEYINFRNNKIIVYNRVGKIFSSYGGERFAFMGYHGDKIVININGNESPQFDDIIPIGFWSDGTFLYAGKSGDSWEIYKNNEPISDVFSNINGVAINIMGNVAAVLARRTRDEAIGMLISDEFYEPLVGKAYHSVDGLALHPTLPMYAYRATYQDKTFIVYSSAEYFGGQRTGKPQFTHDGNDLYYIGCDIDCFVNINGRKYSVNTELDVDMNYAMKPKSNTISYSSSSSIIVRNVTSKNIIAGKMMDEIIQPIYNWRTQRFETLGKISQRLYFIFCKP